MTEIITGGQPTKVDLQEFKDDGVGKVINLRAKGEFPDPELFGEEVRSLGLEYCWFPVSDESDFSKENAAKLVKEIQSGQHLKVLVHCASSNRVGALLAINAFFNDGKSQEESLKIGEDAGLTKMRSFVEKTLL